MKSARTGCHPVGRRTSSGDALQLLYANPAPIAKRKQAPPFARMAAARLASHAGGRASADLRLFTGRKAWDWARWRTHQLPSRPTLVLAPGADPSAFCWTVVAGAEPWVIETGGTPDTVLQRLALALLQAGALVVRLSFWDGSDRSMAVFRP